MKTNTLRKAMVVLAMAGITVLLAGFLFVAGAVTVDYTVNSWGPHQYPAPTTPPANAPWGVDGYPGDTLGMTTYTGTLNLSPGTYVLKINTFKWSIDYTYGGTATDPTDWSDVLHNITAARSISFSGGPSGSLRQSMALDNKWNNDYVTIDNGHTVTFLASGYRVEVTPLGSSFKGWNLGTQPNVDIFARFKVTDAEPPVTNFVSTSGNPSKDSTPYFEWTATDNETSTADLVYSTKLDTGAWSDWTLSTSITLGGLLEGTHTFEVRAKDEAGNIGAAASYTWAFDLTGPKITITVPEDGTEYGLNDTVNSDWVAVDALSGLDTAAASDDANTGMISGDPFYTGSIGLHKFTVTATDLAGNTTTKTVTYRVVYTVHPGGAAGGGGGTEGEGGTFLDKSIAGGGGAVGITSLKAVYTTGDVIHVVFSLTDAKNNNVAGAVVSCTLVKVALGDEEGYDVLNLWGFNYNSDTQLYSLEIATEGLDRGTYDLWLGFDDGTQTRLRIDLAQKGS